MKKALLLLYALLCFQASHSSAQVSPASPQLTLPPGPLIQKRAPEFSQWVITTTVAPAMRAAALVANASQTANVPAKTVVITKTGNIINTAIVDQDRRIWSVWNDGELHVVVSPDGKQVGQAARPLDPNAVNPYYIDYSSSDFPGFEWLSLKNFQDIKSYKGRDCLIFKKANLLAYIDEDTRLPMALVDGEGVHLYQFEPTPSASQKLPDNVRQFLSDQQSHVESLANRKITPF